MQENPRPDEADEGEPEQPDQGMPLLDDVPQQPTTGEPRVPPGESPVESGDREADPEVGGG